MICHTVAMKYYTTNVFGKKIGYYSNNKQGVPTIFQIHGLGSSSEYFKKLNWTIEGEFNIVAVDLVGFGKSDKPENFHYSLMEQTILLDQLIDILELKIYAIVGFSMGGTIAVLLAEMLLPTNLYKLILVEPVLEFEDLSKITLRTAKMPLWQLKLSRVIFPLYEIVPIRIYLKRKKKENRKIVSRGLKNSSTLALQKSAFMLVSQLKNNGLLEQFLNTKCEKYYIIADSTKENMTEEKLTKIRQKAELIIILDAKHVVMLDNETRFNEEIKKILT